MVPHAQSDEAVELPYDDEVDFHDSSFFQKHDVTSLPSPHEVREVASRSQGPRTRRRTRPPPVYFPSLGLCVKYGTDVTIAEGQCLLFMRSKLHEHVPVPEVYKWCKDDGQVFIYMELMDGVTLEKCWEDLNEQNRLVICEQLRCMVAAWRGLGCDSDPAFIGTLRLHPQSVKLLVERITSIVNPLAYTQPFTNSFDHPLGHIGKQPLQDVIFESSCSPTAGPFSNVSEFHDWLTSSFGPRRHDRNKPPHPYRHHLPDDVPIIFTHADLHPSNILVSTGSNPRVIAIIDWHQSGWYPAYWEYCKARWTSKIGDEWETKYIPLFVNRHGCYDYWDYFNLARGV
jgi:hypothetical protein